MRRTRREQIVGILHRECKRDIQTSRQELALAHDRLGQQRRRVREEEKELEGVQQALRSRLAAGAVINVQLYQCAGSAAGLRSKTLQRLSEQIEESLLDVEKLQDGLHRHQQRKRKLEEAMEVEANKRESEETLRALHETEELWLGHARS